jgi:hypothetical protein
LEIGVSGGLLIAVTILILTSEIAPLHTASERCQFEKFGTGK